MPDNNKNNYDYDLGDMIDSAVQFGTQVGSSVLGSIADALEQAGDAMTRASCPAGQLLRLETPPGAQMEKRRPIGGRGAYGCGLDLHRLLRHRSAGAGHPDRCRRGYAGTDTRRICGAADSDRCILPGHAGFSVHGHCGYEKAQLLWPPAQTAASRQRLDLRPAIPGPQGPN